MRLIRRVPKTAFYPRPKVDSAVVLIEPLPEAERCVSRAEQSDFVRLVRTATTLEFAGAVAAALAVGGLALRAAFTFLTRRRLIEDTPTALIRSAPQGYVEINGVVHVLTEDLAGARKCLGDAGFRVIQEQQVALVPVSDEPGAAARVFQRIADAHINVKYSYLATRNRLVIAADNPQAIIEAVK